MTVTSVTVRVPAKINLQLAVGPLRPDGYHGLVTVFHAVSLFDDVTVEPADTDTVIVCGEGAGLVPEDADNLALRAVRALRATLANRAGPDGTGGAGGTVADAPRGGGVAVTITKRIPVAGGMAGGSADAAAALVACNELWRTGLSPGDLCEVAAAVGSDVAFAVLGETAIGRGRGEQLTPVRPAVPATYHWVLALADGHLSTPRVFHALDRQRQDQQVADPELSANLMQALNEGDPIKLGAALTNDLQEPALTLFPALRKTLDAGIEAGALGALVSGSGPTCFFLAGTAAEATTLANALSGAGVCRTVAIATGPAAGARVI
ncbi:MAG TPA: 4-(cytidine 5'-diphospho)-2-C-methyl-D-erythritol kinase [Trebonia sp.]|nr:4-(cytidine 5'-diphospho)-2-C-methyl-D-erythritol kinase [Trebonia sp.]